MGGCQEGILDFHKKAAEPLPGLRRFVMFRDQMRGRLFYASSFSMTSFGMPNRQVRTKHRATEPTDTRK